MYDLRGVSEDFRQMVRGKSVAVVVRDAERVPNTDLVVHVNHGQGLSTAPRCDHVVSVVNAHLFGTMHRLPSPMMRASVFLLRAWTSLGDVYATAYGIDPSKVISVPSWNNTLTTGVWTLQLYELLGAEVYAVGFSRDRAKVYSRSHHKLANETEAAFLERLASEDRVVWRADQAGT